MPGPTAWQQQYSVIVSSNQTITTTTETVVATLSGVNSRSPGVPVALFGTAVFQVQAATTITVLRLRIGSVTGSVVGNAQNIASTAGDVQNADGAVAGVDQPSGEYAGQVYVLTVQATGAGANWAVTLAALQAVV